MDNPSQLVQQILFALDRLGDFNGHHEFEEICFAFARRRISVNLLPATGPVSAGGDQGRDAESFWSNIGNELGSTSTYDAHITSERVVLACTTQKATLPAKIRHDLASITSQGTPAARVLYFTVVGLPVATRHELQEEASEQYGVALEIFDGRAIADQLSDPDLFWIAVQYLHISAESAPERPSTEGQTPTWYLQDRDAWRARDTRGGTMADFITLRGLLRYATFNDDAQSDLGDWLLFMRQLLANATGDDIRMRARYEIAVATLRGAGSLLPADALVHEFYEAMTHADSDLGLLEDAVVLLQYGIGARLRGVTSLTLADLDSWFLSLVAQVERLLGSAPYPNARAALLAIKSRLAFFPDYPDSLPDRIDGLVPARESAQRVLDSYESGTPLPGLTFSLPLRNLPGGMEALRALIEQLPTAPMFPIEHTAEMFDLLALSLAQHPEYSEVRDGLDDAVGRVEGDSAKARRAEARALKFLGAGDYLRALAEVHEAKIGWWHGDTLEDSIPMMLLAASIYEHLGMFFAAKQHAYSAAVVAVSSTDATLRRYVAQGIALAAICDLKAGNSLQGSLLLETSIRAQNAYVEDPTDLERHAYLRELMEQESMLLLVARDFAPDYVTFLEDTAARVAILPFLNDVIGHQPEDESWTLTSVLAAIDRKGRGRPFADAGPTRTHSWAAFGINWNVSSANTIQSVLAAERLMAAIQVIQVELAMEDPVWVAGDVFVEVRLDGRRDETGSSACESIPDNTANRWIVHLLPGDQLDEDTVLTDLTSMVCMILAANSLVGLENFLALVTAAFARGLGHKLSGGRPYDDAADLIPAALFEPIAALPQGPLGAGVAREQALVPEELGSRDGESALYDHDETLANVQRRYDRLLPIGRFTIERLGSQRQSRAIIQDLKAQGWLDWQLLMAITNIIGNARPGWEGLRLSASSPAGAQQRARELFTADETAADRQLPAEAFSADRLRGALEFAALLCLPSYGLHVNQQTPNIPALLEILVKRFHFWDDDVPHHNFFD